MISEKLLEISNVAIARKFQVSIQYMQQHVQCIGVKDFAVKNELKKIG